MPTQLPTPAKRPGVPSPSRQLRLLVALLALSLPPAPADAVPAGSTQDIQPACNPTPAPASEAGQAPPLMRAGVYSEGIDLSQYWVSEKLDGVRAYWNGSALLSRAGNRFHAPPWFTERFPPLPLDGELWMGRGAFEELSGAVRRQTPDPSQWRRIRFLAFDLPSSCEPFTQRLQALQALAQAAKPPYLAPVPQERLPSRKALMARLQTVTEAGGEGLMLHKGSARYQSGRTADLLKLKTFDDAEPQ